ncbi:type II toxin-antitoxin system RelE/ParE family toxin [Streptomyces sp. 21So2-11]|uniref:type II toxin-antitoxin system RelE family toxin n=1 Tax=Streptomyces sp. 21So2-11 TaxID=3144408 RepID=UPI00321BB778
MTYTLVWEYPAMAEFRRLREVDPGGAKACAIAVQELTADPCPAAAAQLAGSGYYRLRVGRWRVLYEIVDETVTVHVAKVGRVA